MDDLYFIGYDDGYRGREKSDNDPAYLEGYAQGKIAYTLGLD